ncbi:hypothetical protein, partial [Aeromonas hydrophila]|uniref:hypothetical protein n=1 Tax=Aeromonas hydrophila TaxID=644 RepID=UPI001C876B20
MNSIKFNAAQQAEGLVLSAFWGESLRQDHQRLYTLQSRLAVLRIRRRVRGLRDRGQVQVLLRQCRQARTTLRHAHARLMRICIG